MNGIGAKALGHGPHSTRQMALIHAIQKVGKLGIVLGKAHDLGLGDGGFLRRHRDFARQTRLFLGPVDFFDAGGLGEDAALEPGGGIQHHAIALCDLRLLLAHELGRHYPLSPAGEPGPLLPTTIVQNDMGVAVCAVVMDRQHVIPLVAIFAALEEMLRPVERDIADLLGADIRGEGQKHMRGEA